MAFWMLPAALAAAGALKGISNEKKMQENDKYRKAAITYSPWTGMGDPGSMTLPGVLESAVQGGAMGASLGGMGMGGGAGMSAAGGAYGTGMGQTMSPDMLKWNLMNQAQGGPGYTTMG